MKIYISGPISDMPEFNAPAFNEAALVLRNAGNDVVNPSELDNAEHHQTWAHYMKRDIALLVFCDEIQVLSGWQGSRGATLECLIGSLLDMPVLAYGSRRQISQWEVLSAFLKRLFNV